MTDGGGMDRRQLLARGLKLAGGTMLACVAGTAAAADRVVDGDAPRIRRLDAGLDRMILPGTPVEVIARGIRWAEGPVWVPGGGGGYLLFSDPPANVVRRWRRGQEATVFLSPSGTAGLDPRQVREPGANGLALDATGALLIANSGGRSIDRLDLGTRRRTTLVDRHAGKRFNSPNDLHVARDGAIWFTDPPYGLTDGDASALKEASVNGVYRWTRDGGTTLIDGTLTRPNGIALSPDERRLYVSVSDEAAPRIMMYDLDARHRPLRRRVLLDAAAMMGPQAPGLPDGMKVARDGTLICSVPGGMMLMTPEARPLGLIETGTAIANCAFGEGGRALFLTASDRVLRVALRPGWQG